MSDDKRDYAVGYGRPPLHSRFQKGGPSPRPGSRPKARTRKTLAEEFDAALSAKVTVRGKDGRRRRMSKFEVMVHRLVAMTMQPKPPARARRLLLKVQGLIGAITPPQAPHGVLVVGEYLSEEEWEATYSGEGHLSKDPLEGLLDEETIARMREQSAHFRDPADDS